MPAYAILGATGNTGLNILQHLLSPSTTSSSPPTIHAFVRSKNKLTGLLPSTAPKSNLQIYEGSITSENTDANIIALAKCLSGVETAFLTVAVPRNNPGCSVAYDTAVAVVLALERLKAENPALKPPHLVVLSSASLDDKFWEGTPTLVHTLIWTAMSNVYTDLARAEAYLRDRSDWLSSSFVMPGGLVNEAPRGHALSTTSQQTFISFADLAAAMIEVAEDGADRWDGAHVSVVLAQGRKASVEWWAGPVLFRGFLTHFFPWIHSYLRFLGGA